jgi:hypothetical protein
VRGDIFMGSSMKKKKSSASAPRPKAKVQEAAQDEIVDTSFENESMESKKNKANRRNGGLANVLG